MIRPNIFLFLSLAFVAYATPSGHLMSGTVLDYWEVLNATVQGRLHASVPFSRSCFKKASVGVLGRFDEAACSAVQAEYANSSLRANFPGAYQETQWETCQATSEQCLLDWTNPTNPAAFDSPNICSQGSIPPYYIEINSVHDVQAAFAFSKLNSIPLVIRHTGHDYKGRSSEIGSLALWTHNLRSIVYNRQFVPSSCGTFITPVAAVTYGAGVLWGDLYEFADVNNITLPGGADATVGAAGGFIQGGGHSPVSNIYGLAVDRVVEFEVVTPNGQHLFASDCQNTDLFFALKGGGGGTFGVVMSVTTRAFPAATFMTVAVQYTPTPASQSKFVDFIISQSVTWANAGWSGVLDPLAFIVLTNIEQSFTEATAFMQPLQNFVESHLNGTFNLVPVPSYLSLFDNFISVAGPPVGVPILLSSRLVPAELFMSKPSELSTALLNITANAERTIVFANTPFNFKSFPGVGPTSVTPAWRNSIWHVTAATTFNFNTTLEGKKDMYRAISDLMLPLRLLTPQSGAYQNEADVHEPNFSVSFWGDNYAKLVSIKRKYDPDSLLKCWQCIDWTGVMDQQFKCYI